MRDTLYDIAALVIQELARNDIIKKEELKNGPKHN